MGDTVARDQLKLATVMVVDMALEEATEDTVVKDLPKLVTAMVVVSVDTGDTEDLVVMEDTVDTEDLVVMEDTAQKEAMVDTVGRDLLMLATAMVVMEEDTEVSEVVTEVSEVDTEVDTEEVMEVTMVDMDTEGIHSVLPIQILSFYNLYRKFLI